MDLSATPSRRAQAAGRANPALSDPRIGPRLTILYIPDTPETPGRTTFSFNGAASALEEQPMNEIPETTPPAIETESPPSSWRRAGAVLTAGVIIKLLVVAIVVASAAVAEARGFFQPETGRDLDRIKEFAGFRSEWMLRHIDATDEQQQRIREILDAAIDDLVPMREGHEDTRAAFTAALTADRVDVEALEALRVEKLAEFDAASSRILAALAEVGEVLTPEQRQQLAERAEKHRGHWGRHHPAH